MILLPHPRALVVSLHDVSPQTQTACAEILSRLAALGVSRTSLLVIPDHHRRGHVMHNESCCEWLRARASLGDEIVLHGYFHQRARQPGESAKAKLTTRIYTADEGELFDLNYTTARELLTRGREDFRKLALDPVGFIAPAWLLGTEAERAVRELGFTYTTRLGSVSSFATGNRHSSQSLVWSVRSAWRRQMSLAWNATIFQRLRSNPLLRISIHPVDLKHPQIWSQIERLITSALRDRSALTYAEWIARTDKQLTVPDLV